MKTFQDGDPLFGVMMNAIANLWPNGTAVLSGCAPTGSGAARQVTVAAGSVVINGTVRSVSQQTKTLDAATFDRYDLISVNTSGTVVVTKGTEERRVPALPANSVPIAICLIETGQTTLPADRIYDSRMDALRLSVLNIDADKDWNGKNITNVNSVDAVTLYGEKIYTAYTVAASANNLVTFPDRAVSGREGLVRIVHFIVGTACQGTNNSLRVSGYVASGGGYISAIQVRHNSTTVLNNGSVKNAAFSVDLSGVKANDVIEIYMSTASFTNTASALAISGDATAMVYHDIGTTL